jgi:hypothetical protein
MKKEKVKDVYNKGLVSLEILKLNKKIKTLEEAEKLYEETVETKTFLIDDLTSGEPYAIRLAYTTKKKNLKSVDPEFLDDSDKFELSESIQDILRNEGFPVIESNFPEAPENQDFKKVSYEKK